MARTISDSVGKGGKNVGEDVIVVKELLNAVAKDCGFAKLKLDETAGSKLFDAIGLFQERSLAVKPSKQVRRGSKEMEILNKGPQAVRLGVLEWQRMIEMEKEARRIGIKPAILSKYCAQGVTDIALIPCDLPRVTGKTAKLKPKLMFVLESVSAHFGVEIRIRSGFRTRAEQADTMWNNWTGTLDRGKKYKYIKNRPELQTELDGYYNEGKKAEFKARVEPIAHILSRHIFGEAVDLDGNPGAKPVKALDGMLNRVMEDGCIHYDILNVSVPSKISDATLRSWAR